MNLLACPYHLPVRSWGPIRLLEILKSNNQRMLTESAVSRTGDASGAIEVSSSFNLVLGLEKDLKTSDCSLFTDRGLLAGFFSTSFCRSALPSGATAACTVDFVDFEFDAGGSDGLTTFLCSLLMPWLELVAFSLTVSAETGNAPVGGRLPVLRYKPHRQGLGGFNKERGSLLSHQHYE